VTVVDPDPVHALLLSRRLGATVVPGDGTDPVVLERAGARRADAVLALSARDHENLAVCLAARRRFGVSRTVALVNDPEHEEVFRRLGVTAAVSATRILAGVLEGEAGSGGGGTLLHAAGGSVAVGEIALREGSPAAGREVREIPFPEGALLGCVVRDGEAIVPRGETRLLAGDRLLVIARPELHDDLAERLAGPRG
jgi:trk system potassium uptake protein TrkA